MANYYCSSRSNYFRVKDVAAFEAWAKHRGVEIHASHQPPDHFAVFPQDNDIGSFPTYDFEAGDELDFIGELSAHLAEGSVAVILETGAEKLRYLVGHAVAINARGERVEVSLEEIYGRAERELGAKEVTRAEY